MSEFYCPKCKATGMKVNSHPTVTAKFNSQGDCFDYDFDQGPGEYDDEDPAFCPQDCGFVGKPSDFAHDDEEEDHHLQCKECGASLTEPCNDLDCEETEDHESSDLVCTECYGGE